jgi:hypothetical protein
MNRRSIITMIIGAIAALTGFAVTELLRQRRCTGAGGEWAATTRECMAPSGDRMAVAAITDVVVGVATALILAFMLFRVLLFVMGRRPRRTP